MGQPAAKQGDQILATDIHIILIPAVPAPPIPTLTPSIYGYNKRKSQL
jgi:hypothetical protein